MDELASRVLTVGGPWALVTLFVIMVLRGDLVPRRIYEAKSRETDTWRSTAETAAEALRKEQRHSAELMELSRTGVHILASLPHAAEGVTGHVPVDRAPTPPG